MLFPQLFLFLSRFPLYLANSSLPKNSGRFLLDIDSSSARWLDTSTRTVPTPAHSPGARGQGTQDWFVLALICREQRFPTGLGEAIGDFTDHPMAVLFFFPYVYILNTLMLNKYAEEMNDDNRKMTQRA